MQRPYRTRRSTSFSLSSLRSGQLALCALIIAAVFSVEAEAGGEGSASSSCGSSSSSGSSRRLAGRRLGSGPPWYCQEYEKDYFEAAASAAMLVLAMGFEFVYHHFLHMAEHSFVYGQSMLSDEERKASVHRSLFGKPLRLILFSRMGGEFMVLGFLAFTIWTSNQQGLFDAVGKIDPSDIRTPSVGSDILHLMEEVHMQIFVAMILYFTIVFRVVLYSDYRIQALEKCRADWIKQLFDGTGGEDDSNILRAFKLWRGHFSKGCVPAIFNWRESKPTIFAEVAKSLKVEKALEELTLDDLQESISARFSFCTYTVFSLGSSVLEIVNVTHETWICIILLKSFYAFLHRYGKIPLVQIAPFFCLIASVFIFGLFFVTHRFMSSLCHEERQNVLLFFLCHSWAGYMISKTFWEGAFKHGDADKILEAIIYPLVLCVMALVLPKCVPDFAITMSLPPFFSYKNEKVLQLVSVQVVDQEMVRARAAVKKRMEEAGTGGAVKARLKSIYHGTPTIQENDDGEGDEADDTIIQPFLDHNPPMQAQHHAHAPKPVKKKAKPREKNGSSSSAPGKKPGSNHSNEGTEIVKKIVSNSSVVKKAVVGKAADETE